jgi:nitrite reductase/ring-hydroxylating ferredoxin subunit
MTWRFPWLPTARRDATADAGDYPNEADADRADANRADPNAGNANEADARWVDVGGLADLRHNRLVVEANGMSVLVVRVGRTLAAVENECPHLGQRLSDGQVRGGLIRCAAHGYRWDLATGQSVQGLRVPRRRPLRAVPLRLAGDRIMLAWDEGATPY